MAEMKITIREDGLSINLNSGGATFCDKTLQLLVPLLTQLTTRSGTAEITPAAAESRISGGAGTEAAAPHEPKLCGYIVPPEIKALGKDWRNAPPFRSFMANSSRTKEDMVETYALRDGCKCPKKSVKDRIQEIAGVFSPEEIVARLDRFDFAAVNDRSMREFNLSLRRDAELWKELCRRAKDDNSTMRDIYGLFTSDELAVMKF